MTVQLVGHLVAVGLIPMDIGFGQGRDVDLQCTDCGCLGHDREAFAEADAIDVLECET